MGGFCKVPSVHLIEHQIFNLCVEIFCVAENLISIYFSLGIHLRLEMSEGRQSEKSSVLPDGEE